MDRASHSDGLRQRVRHHPRPVLILGAAAVLMAPLVLTSRAQPGGETVVFSDDFDYPCGLPVYRCDESIPPNIDIQVGEWRALASSWNGAAYGGWADVVEVRPTSTIDTGVPGNVMRFGPSTQTTTTAATWIIAGVNPPIAEVAGQIIRVRCDWWVGPAGGGGTLMIGNARDEAANAIGTDASLERMVQISWLPDGRLQAAFDTSANRISLLSSYPRSTWQQVLVEIDLGADRFSVWTAPRGQPLVQVGSNITFRSGLQSRMNYVALVHFFTQDSTVDFAVDNLSVTTVP